MSTVIKEWITPVAGMEAVRENVIYYQQHKVNSIISKVFCKNIITRPVENSYEHGSLYQQCKHIYELFG